MEPLLEDKRDPEEEFFVLAVLSVKMQHAEEVEDIAYCQEMDASLMFK